MAQGQKVPGCTMTDARLRVLAEIDGLTVSGCTQEEWETEIPTLIAAGYLTQSGRTLTEAGEAQLVGVVFPMIGGA